MENLKDFDLVELKQDELKEIDGGVFLLAFLVAGAFLGYFLAKMQDDNG